MGSIFWSEYFKNLLASVDLFLFNSVCFDYFNYLSKGLCLVRSMSFLEVCLVKLLDVGTVAAFLLLTWNFALFIDLIN